MTKIITRFAPSPTGFLHIGGARTALFNYLFSKHNKGKFFLRIEDTDKQRSTKEAKEAIFSVLKWLRLDFDPFNDQQDVVYQSERFDAYSKLIDILLDRQNAYKCFATLDQIEEQKEKAKDQNKSFVFRSPWRDKPPPLELKGKPYVIRFKVDQAGSTILKDELHGQIKFDNSTIEDFILSRSNKESLYNLCAVCDDYYMGITHIIRGDDHITNAVRQQMIYNAMNWQVPFMLHIPLIHGPDGNKLSKRHGATNVEEYKNLGYLPESLTSYLLRLGWSYEGDNILDLEQAIKIFDIKNLGKSAARIDFDKIKSINAFYIKQQDDLYLTNFIDQEIEKKLQVKLSIKSRNSLQRGMNSLKIRVKLMSELIQMARIYIHEIPIEFTDQAREILQQTDKSLVTSIINLVQELDVLTHDALQEAFKKLAHNMSINLGNLIKPIRCLLTGSMSSPGVFEIMEIMGKQTVIGRLKKFNIFNPNFKI